eukprot:m.209737 g.209737  ORF g.209737 m.209737 type:complete len:805 (+) comp15048_c0_seq8:192-2606(+)
MAEADLSLAQAALERKPLEGEGDVHAQKGQFMDLETHRSFQALMQCKDLLREAVTVAEERMDASRKSWPKVYETMLVAFLNGAAVADVLLSDAPSLIHASEYGQYSNTQRANGFQSLLYVMRQAVAPINVHIRELRRLDFPPRSCQSVIPAIQNSIEILQSLARIVTIADSLARLTLDDGKVTRDLRSYPDLKADLSSALHSPLRDHLFHRDNVAFYYPDTVRPVLRSLANTLLTQNVRYGGRTRVGSLVAQTAAGIRQWWWPKSMGESFTSATDQRKIEVQFLREYWQLAETSRLKSIEPRRLRFGTHETHHLTLHEDTINLQVTAEAATSLSVIVERSTLAVVEDEPEPRSLSSLLSFGGSRNADSPSSLGADRSSPSLTSRTVSMSEQEQDTRQSRASSVSSVTSRLRWNAVDGVHPVYSALPQGPAVSQLVESVVLDDALEAEGYVLIDDVPLPDLLPLSDMDSDLATAELKRSPFYNLAQSPSQLRSFSEHDISYNTLTHCPPLADWLMDLQLGDASSIGSEEQSVTVQVRSYHRIQATDLSESVIFHIHGGGFISQTSQSHEGYLRSWAKACRCPIVSVDYRLAPEHPYPIPLLDCFFAYHALLANPSQFGTQAKRIILAGDGTGGTLCFGVALKAVLEGIRRPDAILTNYAMIDLAPDHFAPSRLLGHLDPSCPEGVYSSCVDAYMPSATWDDIGLEEQESRFDDCLLNPCSAPDGLLQCLPPVAMLVGSLDPLLDENVAFASRLSTKVGRPVHFEVFNEVPHGYLTLAQSSLPISNASVHACRTLERLTQGMFEPT